MEDLDNFELGLMNTKVDFDPADAVQTLEDATKLIGDLDAEGQVQWKMEQAAKAREICIKAAQIIANYKVALVSAPRTWAPEGTASPPFESGSTHTPLYPVVASVQFTDPEEQSPEAAGDVVVFHIDYQGT